MKTEIVGELTQEKEIEYWKTRCELAENYIQETPCDPDIYHSQMMAYKEWVDFKQLNVNEYAFSFSLLGWKKQL